MTDPKKDEEDVEERSAPRAPIIYEVVRRHGEEEMERPSMSLFWSGAAAGLSISFSLLAQAVLELRLPQASWAPLVSAAGYPVGFLMVILARQQLFTESTITMVLPVVAEPTGRNLRSLARVWTIVLGSNLVGTFTAALFCTFTPVLDAEVLHEMLEVSRHALDKSWWVMLFQGITAGFLMAATVWLLPTAGGAQFHVVFLMTYLIAISGSAHIVAGSIEAFMLLLDGALGPGQMLLGFMVPALLGNIIGGTGLFTMISYAQVRREI